ncbi:ankyrin repeat domain-containing protein [Wolbachia endosymbiont (group A) of Conops quadrifasciatus]|uniref:ankyrin repeat domain-containing protein n=1 Tax=Wolbachia endosymbiont (group A) of Conops quadrifasciatus TaxID=3066143 RepID=UPI003132F27A
MRFSKEKREAFNKSFYELLENSFKNINEKDEKGETILHKAARMSTREKVSFLVKKGADINARDNKGFTPLHWAVFARNLENVKVLIRGGAEINATQYIGGCTPLHSACRIGAGIAIIKELVKAGAAINQLDKYGATPMYYIWESERYCLWDNGENEKARKFLRKQGGITKSRKVTCYEIENLVEEIAYMLDRSYLPELKIIEIKEIRKRDKALIREECKNLASKIMCKVNEMIDEVVEADLSKMW